MEIFIPGNVPSSKNNKVWTGRFLVWSKSAQKYKKETKKYWEDYRDQFLIDFSDRTLPCAVSFKFIRGSRHQFDYVNPLQTILDLMVENGWLTDDNADVILPVFEQYEYSKDNPGVIIKLYETNS
jgi:Holliday junction resolvase RusA-like endonuclease